MLTPFFPEGYPFFVYWVKRVCALLSLIIMAFLLFASFKRRNSGQKEDRAFFLLVCLVTVFCVLCVIGNFMPVMFDPERSGRWMSVAVMATGNELPNLFSVLVAIGWLVFVDIAVYHSRDSILRRYAPNLIPIPAILLLNVLAILNSWAFWTKGSIIEFMDVNRYGGLIAIAEILVCMVSMAAYMFYAHNVMYTYQKEMEQPVFLRLDVFIIPWFAAFVIDVLFLISVYPLAHALALLFTYLAMRNRYRYLDRKTGFYNRASMDFLAAHMDRTGYGKGAAILFQTESGKEEAPKLLSSYKPEKSILLQLEEGEFLLFSDITNRPALKLLSDTVEMAAAQMSPPVEMKTRFWLRNRDEDTDSFIKRVLEESSVI